MRMHRGDGGERRVLWRARSHRRASPLIVPEHVRDTSPSREKEGCPAFAAAKNSQRGGLTSDIPD